MKRRSNGEHSAIWNKQRDKWIAKATQGLPRPVTAQGDTRAESLANLRKRLAVKPHEVVGLPIRPTFAKWWEYASANISLDGTPEHRRNNDANIRRYCFPTLGHVKLSEMNDTHGDQLLRVLRDQGLSNSTQITGLKAARFVLNLAVRKKVIPSNPFSDVKPPKRNTKRRFLTADEVRRLQKVGRGHEYEIVPKLLLACGLRSGELCGLEWEHVHLTGAKPRIEIRQQVQNGRLIAPKYGSFRTVALPSALVEALEKQQARQDERVPTRQRKAKWDGHSFVVTTPTLAPLDQHRVREILHEIGTEAGISPHPKHGKLGAHQLRYTSGSLLLDGGANLKEVSVFLGHKDIGITSNVYLGLYDGASQRLAEIGNTFIL